MNSPIAHDARITITELRKYLARAKSTKLYQIVKFGQKRKSDGVVVRMEARRDPVDGVLRTTLEDYWRYEVRLDPNLIADLERYADGRRLCLAICCACEMWLKFKLDATKEFKDEVLKHSFHWRRYHDEGWLCAKCQEGT